MNPVNPSMGRFFAFLRGKLLALKSEWTARAAGARGQVGRLKDPLEHFFLSCFEHG